MKTFLNWTGEKHLTSETIVLHFPAVYNRYLEPFVGGGSVLFAHNKPFIPVIANDNNSVLINAYKMIKRQPRELIQLLKILQRDHSKEYYIEMKNIFNKSLCTAIEKAGLFIYLNNTCYKGLYYTDKQGFFKVPCEKDEFIFDEDNILELSVFLNQNDIKFYSQDYIKFLQYAEAGDFIYLDPPYHPLGETKLKTKERYFSSNEQKTLKQELDLLTEKGVKWLVSNAYCDFIKELYQGYSLEVILSQQNKVKEFLIKNY